MRPANTVAKSRSAPSGTAARPAELMACAMDGWLATRTSWPAACSAQPIGTRLNRCDGQPQVDIRIRIAAVDPDQSASSTGLPML